MNCYLFANPPPVPFFTGLGVGLVVVAALIIAFLRRPTKAQPRRPIALAVVALCAGPLSGVVLAALVLIFGNIPPLDRMWYLQSFATVGAIAGVIGAAMIAIFARSGAGASTDGHQEIESPQRR